MASTNFTTHYSIPLPLGTDLTTPMDYNEAAEAVDTALFAAETDAGNASEAAAAAVTTANAAADAVNTVAGDLSQEKAKIVALQTRVTNAENEIDDVRVDSSDMITAYNEPTATASHAYAIGDYFIYNNTLYKATAAIAIGATIVPDTNCETTNVSSELIEINSALSDKQDKTDNTLATTSKQVVGAINELNSALSDKQDKTDNTLATTSKQVVGAINELNSNFNNKFRSNTVLGVNETITLDNVTSNSIYLITCVESSNPNAVHANMKLFCIEYGNVVMLDVWNENGGVYLTYLYDESLQRLVLTNLHTLAIVLSVTQL